MNALVDLADKGAIYAILDADKPCYSLDVNVLLHASDRSSDRHTEARRFLDACAGGPEILCLA
jgi:hypothetical protein